jgi:hypothetical protein
VALTKSVAEKRGDVLLRVTKRGRASLNEAALILRKSWPTIKAKVDLQEIRTYQYGKRQWVSVEELRRLGATLPTFFAE